MEIAPRSITTLRGITIAKFNYTLHDPLVTTTTTIAANEKYFFLFLIH